MIEKLVWLFVIWLSLDTVNSQLSKANNAFAVDLGRKIGDANIGKNVFYSPISIATAFGMVFMGARGETREQMKAVLHLDKLSSDEAVKEAYKQLLTALKGQANDYTLHMVNRLFGSKAFKFHKQFLQEVHKYFLASVESLDFEGKPEESRRHINQWVEEQTNQKIKDLLPDGSIDANTILVIVTAIYFKALWVYPFDEKLTKPGPFRTSKTKRVLMDMMHLNDKILNYHNSSELNCEVLELPYQGNKASMFIFLPRDVEGLRNLAIQLTVDKVASILKKLRPKNISVQLPKFKMDQDISLKKYLQMMGMVDVFDKARADLSGVGSGPLVVTDAIHKAFISVSESGTEAAAATGIVVGVLSILLHPIQFIVDRPFFFLIIEKNTRSVLFIGLLVRPPTPAESV